jgi:uncharacterized protein
MPTIRWRQWSESAFADAATANAPVLLSIVTAWSEECAVMDATTYGHPEVVAIIHERFIPIRVDADRRPDVSERYSLGGWPTTAWLTPDGEVLSGGTYVGAEQMIALLNQVADAWRDRAPEIRARAASLQHDVPRPPSHEASADRRAPDLAAVDWFRALLLEEFDATHGGFGSGSKYPHAPAMRLALAVAGEDADEAMRQIAEVTLERMGALWDPANGGFYRYADAPDWGRPGTEKTLEDNAALLGVYLDAAIRLQSDDYRNRAAELVRWVKGTLADEAGGGFYNAQAAVSRVVDRSMYVDRNADMIAALLRAAALFEDPWLRDFALKSLETVILPGYAPGGGVVHEYVGRVPSDPAPTRGLLGDQIRVASSLIWAHVITEQLPYSMLALELVQFAIRTMWDEQAGCFRDRASGESPVHPFALNCEAACVLNRLATLTGDQTHYDRAIAILGFFAPNYRRHGLFGAPYALATREVIDRRVPLGLELSPVDWHLDKD